MNIKQAKIKLEKINALFRNISMDESSITDIEKDLMRSYIQQFYEAFLNIEISESKGSETFKAVEKEVKKVSTSEILETKIEQQKIESARDAVVEKNRTTEATTDQILKEDRPNPKTEELPLAEKEKVEAPKLDAIAVSKKEKAIKPVEATVIKKQKEASTDIDEELEAIFDVPEAKELSDKLSRLPIPDLTKAFGVNEKIFTINELFDGDKDRFKKTIKHLNTCSNYSEAKEYLIKKVAAHYDWVSPSKKKKAINFIRLVHRRYS